MQNHLRIGTIAGSLCGILIVVLAIAWSPPRTWKHKQTKGTTWLVTPFNKSKIEHQGSYRCLTFIGNKTELTQSCIHLTNPLDANAEYIRMMFSLSLLKPQAKRILILGLGGAALPKLFRHYAPQAATESVDIDPGMIPIARFFFQLQTDQRTQVFVDDARGFVRERIGHKQYDFVFIDCFDANYIPPHLLTPSFFKEVKSLLTPTGIAAANLFMTHASYEQTRLSWRKVFPGSYQLTGKTSGNVIAFGSPSMRWKSQAHMQKMANLGAGTKKYHYQIKEEFKKASMIPTPPKGTKPLSQIAPLKRNKKLATLACQSKCCGRVFSWSGVEQRRSANKTFFSVKWKGHSYAANGQCYARIKVTHTTIPSKTWLEHYAILFTKQHMIWNGILTEGKGGTLRKYNVKTHKTATHQWDVTGKRAKGFQLKSANLSRRSK